MIQNPINPKDVYELIENDKGEIMVLLFADGQPPEKPFYYLNEQEKTLELMRSPSDSILIDGLQSVSIEKIKPLSQIYVCEMKYNEDENAEDEIVYAYTATLKKKDQKPQQLQKEDLSEKARRAREEILKKAQKS